MAKIYNNKELELLLDDVYSKIEKEILQANREGRVEELLYKYDFETKPSFYCENRIAKVLVIGESEVDKEHLIKTIKEMNLDYKRFEFVLTYEEASNYNMSKLRYNAKYSDIFFGPISHKTKGMGDSSSIITELENDQESYPKITRLIANKELKITKESFKEALEKSKFKKIIEE